MPLSCGGSNGPLPSCSLSDNGDILEGLDTSTITWHGPLSALFALRRNSCLDWMAKGGLVVATQVLREVKHFLTGLVLHDVWVLCLVGDLGSMEFKLRFFMVVVNGRG